MSVRAAGGGRVFQFSAASDFLEPAPSIGAADGELRLPVALPHLHWEIKYVYPREDTACKETKRNLTNDLLFTQNPICA